MGRRSTAEHDEPPAALDDEGAQALGVGLNDQAIDAATEDDDVAFTDEIDESGLGVKLDRAGGHPSNEQPVLTDGLGSDELEVFVEPERGDEETGVPVGLALDNEHSDGRIGEADDRAGLVVVGALLALHGFQLRGVLEEFESAHGAVFAVRAGPDRDLDAPTVGLVEIHKALEDHPLARLRPARAVGVTRLPHHQTSSRSIVRPAHLRHEGGGFTGDQPVGHRGQDDRGVAAFERTTDGYGVHAHAQCAGDLGRGVKRLALGVDTVGEHEDVRRAAGRRLVDEARQVADEQRFEAVGRPVPVGQGDGAA